MTKNITPEALMQIYKVLGRKLNGKVAVKISIGEPCGNNYLHPELIKDLVKSVNGMQLNLPTCELKKLF